MKNYRILLIVLTFLVLACNKTANTGGTTPTPTPTPVVTKIAPDGFTYHTSKLITISINTLSNDNKPLSEVPLNIYSINTGAVDQLLYKGFTDASGNFTTTINVPSAYDTLVIDPAYIGLVRLAKVLIVGNTVTCTIGGSNGYSGNIVGTLSVGRNLSSQTTPKSTIIKTTMGYTSSGNVKFVAMGTTEGMGRPVYREATPDIISDDMLKSINTSIPERVNVAKLHPQYISAGAASNIVVTEKADVWLTFVYEGAGYRNSIAYYKYPTNNPPKTMYDIDSIHFVFPNCSLIGSSGSMVSGDKVKLGTFQPGTTIGLVLFADGWNGAAVNYYAGGAYFTDSYMNPEVNQDLKKHTVLLQYNNTYMIGFEDINREYTGCDHDFNDVIVYATSNPISAISNIGVSVADTPLDTDKDGVSDANDAFPSDPTRAYINYFPAENTYGTLAYEDQWPVTGDYDINDLVVNYHYKIISNAQNNIVEFFADYVPIAAGATYYNGFGVAFPFSSSEVKTVTGQSLNNNYIKLNANGTEASQTNAVIIPFDNHSNLIRNPGNASILNTDMAKAKMTGDTSHIYLQFNSPISKASFGNAPFNPFAISNQRRTHEVHLPGLLPTDLADKTLLGTLQDATNISSNIYYVTKDNHPWALSFLTGFSYPVEGVDISKAYLHFLDWTNSGGTVYTDWYSNTGTGYRNNTNMYTK
jgi:LruC domain-containing protein